MSSQRQQNVDDEYDAYNYDADKYAAGSGHSGKCRTKKEAEQHTNRTDPGGHTRKTTQKLINSHDKEKEERRAHSDGADKSQQKKSCMYFIVRSFGFFHFSLAFGDCAFEPNRRSIGTTRGTRASVIILATVVGRPNPTFFISYLFNFYHLGSLWFCSLPIV